MQTFTAEAGVAWNPGSWRHFPWVAVANLLGFLVCCGALSAILGESDGKEVNAWPHPSHTIPVSVLLSLIVGVANLCLAVTLSKGYEISWWTQALKGAELRKLHFDLEIQRRTSAILGQNRANDKFALAAIVSLIVSILDGPLIQRASTVSAHLYGPSPTITNVNVWNTSFPANFSAFSGGGDTPNVLSPLFGNVSRAYTNREAILLPMEEACNANTTCIFTLPAPGFDVSCNDDSISYDFNNIGAAYFGDQIENPNGLNNQITTFNVNFTFGGTEDILPYSTMNTSIIYKADAGCAAQMTRRTCVMRLATIGYPVAVTNGVATLRSWQMGQNETIEVTQFSKANSPLPGYDVLYTGSVGAGGFQTMLGGIFFVVNSLYASHFALCIGVTTNGYLFNGTERAASHYLNSDMSTYSRCNMTWGDPTTDIINTVRELMLRSAVAYSDYNRTAGLPQQLTMQVTKVSSAYNSHYEYLAITLACMIIQALIVGFLLLNWHHLGRDMSLDAFEIARALEAPLLQGESTNSSIQEALSIRQHDRLRYGEILPRPVEAEVSDRVKQSTVRQRIENDSPYEMEQLIARYAEHEMQADDRQIPRLSLAQEGFIRSIRPGVLY
ncbi:uncharacterized protein E0L32_000279 [Thyridium curvatum]|uniref:Uncharacterized protein n=1 Tax=Thyridium curvatum TaxID=1093900 RepID=A0A507AYQ1_9PEZI|nr:uncharacterized protein E0L32_000279 [Thyridium curvatum]TPX15945.1 hypothetical protein E0L32_000279 [Thyridium curvatum]